MTQWRKKKKSRPNLCIYIRPPARFKSKVFTHFLRLIFLFFCCCFCTEIINKIKHNVCTFVCTSIILPLFSLFSSHLQETKKIIWLCILDNIKLFFYPNLIIIFWTEKKIIFFFMEKRTTTEIELLLKYFDFNNLFRFEKYTIHTYFHCRLY